MKPIITDVEIEPEKLKELNRILNGGYSKGVKKQAMAKIAWRGCTICGKTPSKKVRYDIGDSEQPASRLEYYCDIHFVPLTATNDDQNVAIREQNSQIGA